MACTTGLLDQLPGATAGGVWTYLGYSVNFPQAPGAGGTAPGALVGDNPILDWADFIAGFYHFAYTVGEGDCEITSNLIINVQAQGVAGTGGTESICKFTTDTIDLFDYLTGNTTGGVWSENDSSPNSAGGALSGSVLTVTGLPAGTYIFDYNVSLSGVSGFLLSDCADCYSLASVIINLEEDCAAGTGGAFTFPSGSFNLYDLLTGIPDPNGVWVQTAGSDVITITGGFLGTINLDDAEDCEYEFKYTCDALADCTDESFITFVQQPNLNVTVAYNSGTDQIESTVTGCNTTTAYQWQVAGGGTYTDIPGETGANLSTFDFDTLYRVVVNCGNCTEISNAVSVQIDCSCNNPGISIEFDADTDCLDIVSTGTPCSTIATDVVEYREVGSPTWIAGNQVCNCDLFDFLDVTPTCSNVTNSINIGYNTPLRCGGSIDRVVVLYGNGTQTTEAGADITSTFFTINKADFVNLYNREVTLSIRLKLGGSVFLFQEISYFWNGGTTGGSCADLTITKLNEPRLYKDIEARRTVTFTDGCPPVTFNDQWDNPDNCDNFYVLLTSVNLGGGDPGISGEVFNCASVTRQWYRNGVLLTGETGFFLNISTYGDGFYELIATGCGCTGSASINLTACNQALSVAEVGGGQYTATFSGCVGSKTYDWQRLIGGVWTTQLTVTTTSNTHSYTPTVSGSWRVRATCAADGCISTAPFTVNIPCTASVVLTYNGSNLIATASNCAGSKTYVFQRWNGSSWVNVATVNTTNNTAGYTPTINGLYRVNFTCNANGCTDTDQISVELPCTINVSVTEIGGGVYQGSVSNCPSTKTWLWQRWNGSSWQTERNVTNANSTDNHTVNIAALYRLQVTCSENNCVDIEQFNYTPDCNVVANILRDGNILIANVTGCSGAISYSWFFRATPGSGSWGSPVGFGSTYNTFGNEGEYQLVVGCDGCTDSDTITITGCNVSVSVNCAGNPLSALVTGCSGAITYTWQYSPTGTGWSQVGNASTLTPQSGAGFYRVIVQCDGCVAVSNTCEIADNCNVIAILTDVDDKCDWSCPVNFDGNTPSSLIVTVNFLIAINGSYNLQSSAGRLSFKTDLEAWLNTNGYGGIVTFTLDIYGKFGTCINISCTKANPQSVQYASGGVDGTLTTWFGNCGKSCTYLYTFTDNDCDTISSFNFGCTTVNTSYDITTDGASIKTYVENALTGAGYTGVATVNMGARTVSVVTNAPMGTYSQGRNSPGDTSCGLITNRSATQNSCGAPARIYPTITLALSNCSGTQIIQWQRQNGAGWDLVQTGGLTYQTCVSGTYRAIGSCGDCDFTSNTIVV